MIGPRHLCVFALFSASACHREPPVPDEATLRAIDAKELERIVASDVRASQAMRDADEATFHGHDDSAIEIVEKRATPAVDEGVREADGAAMKTPWGTAKRDELAGILHDRKAEMARYEAAIKSGEPDERLTAIEAQAKIERRALATVAALKEQR